MTEAEAALRAVRDLHRPTTDGLSQRPICAGDDVEGFEAESPEWPCSTAVLVYSAEEIAAAKGSPA